MPESDLISAISSSSGRVAIGKGIDYSGVFEVLGADTVKRATVIGDSSANGVQAQGNSQYENGTIDNINFGMNGNWGTDTQYKLVKLRLGAFGGAPYEANEKVFIASDPSGHDLNQGAGNGFIFPNEFNVDRIEALGTSSQGVECRGGISINASMGQAWLSKFIGDNMVSFSEGGNEFQTLMDKYLIHAEIVFKTGANSGERIVMAVIPGDRITNEDQFRAAVTAICCADSIIERGGLKLFVEDNKQIYGNTDNKLIVPYTYDNKKGVISGLSVSKLQELASSNKLGGSLQYKFTQPDIFVRFFITEENYSSACAVIGKQIPPDIKQVNGSAAVQRVTSSVNAGDVEAYSGSTQVEEIWNRIKDKPLSFSGNADLCKYPRGPRAIYRNAHQGEKCNVQEIGQVTIPWPCYVRCLNHINAGKRWPGVVGGYCGPKEFFNGGAGASSKIRARKFTSDELKRIEEQYNAAGKVKLMVNGKFEALLQAWFNDIAAFYGSDIMVLLPPMCCITGEYSVKHATNSAHRFAMGFDFDYDNEPYAAKPPSTSIFWKERDRIMKPLREITKHYKMRWGGESPWGGKYDLMHFDCD